MTTPLNDRLEANPDFYDYMHSIDFDANGDCEFLDGGGQVVNLAQKGQYQNTMDGDHGNISFTINDTTFTVNYHIETGLFVLRNEICWNSPPEEWPISIYKRRYVFECDPFNKLNNSHRENNLYFMIEGDKENSDNLRYYYARQDLCRKDHQELTDKEKDVLAKTDWLKPDTIPQITLPTLQVNPVSSDQVTWTQNIGTNLIMNLNLNVDDNDTQV